MTPRRRRCAIALLALLASCGGPSDDAGLAPSDGPRADAVLSTAEIRIADRPEIHIRVTTPADRRVLPPEPPQSLAGFEIVEWRTLPVVHEPRRWVHAQTVTLRAREIGRFEWPAMQLTVAAPDGARDVLELAPIALVVGSILDEHPNRTAPFGARAAPDPPRVPRHSPFALAAAGAALALAAAALFVLARRRARPARTQSAGEPAPWSAALRELDRAAAVEDGAAAASHRAATALREYMSRRFGARTRMHTTEELTAAVPPYGATSSWPTFVTLLSDLDELRFRPAVKQPSDRNDAAFDALLARARHFVETTTPPEGLR